MRAKAVRLRTRSSSRVTYCNAPGHAGWHLLVTGVPGRGHGPHLFLAVAQRGETRAFSLSKLKAVENLMYDNGVAADVNFTGTGNRLANDLRGGSSDDKLNDGLGADQMVGAVGNDTYVVGNAGDVVDETGGSPSILHPSLYGRACGHGRNAGSLPKGTPFGARRVRFGPGGAGEPARRA